MQYLDEPKESREFHRCIVAILPEPLALTGIIMNAAPIRFETVRIRTRVVKKKSFLKTDVFFSRLLDHRAKELLKIMATSRSHHGVDPLGVAGR